MWQVLILAGLFYLMTIGVTYLYESAVRFIYRDVVRYSSVEPAFSEVQVGDQLFFISDREIRQPVNKIIWNDRLFCATSESGPYALKASYIDRRVDVPPVARSLTTWPFDGYRVPSLLSGLWCRGWHEITVYPVEGVSLSPIVIEGDDVFRVLP